MRVLIIDDEPIFYRTITKILRGVGHHVSICATPDAALKYLRQRRTEIDLIVLDIMMPSGRSFAEQATLKGRYTGLLLLGAIRAVRPEVPILVTSIIADDQVVQRLSEYPHCT